MSLPEGSKELGVRIGPSNVYYLADTNTVSTSFTVHDFTPSNGKPKNNYIIKNIDPNLIKTIEESLPETSSNIAKLFNNFPDIIERDTDIVVGSSETDIEVSFISEGAGYLNAVGYYFYYIDDKGDPKVITNADDNKNENETDNYYRPTIIFPNASLSRSGGDLRQGGTRTLKGNMPNGKFSNVRVGFFLISNGWKTTGDGYLSTGTGYTMHTTKQLNANYNPAVLNDYTATADDYRRGIQSVLLYYVSEGSWILSFEDILRPSGDSDFNDVVLLVKRSQALTEEEENLYSKVTPSTPINHPAQADADGLFLWLNADKMCRDGATLYFEREMHFKTKTIKYKEYGEDVEKSPKDYMKGLVQKLNWNNTNGKDGIIDGVNDNDNVFTQRFTFLPQDIQDGMVNGYCKLYILRRQYNIDDQTIINDREETNYDILLQYQSALIDKWYSTTNEHDEDDAQFIENETFRFKCDDVTNEELETGTGKINFEKATVVQLLWGDPYVQKIDGGLSKLPDIPGIYTLLKNKQILIEAETALSPHTEQLPHLKGSTFYKSVIIEITDKAKFEIDMRTLKFNSSGDVKYSLGYNKETIESITDISMRDAIANEKNLQCLTVHIDNIVVSFVMLPSSIDIQNMILFDLVTLKPYCTFDTWGGMIAEDRCFMRPSSS